MVGVALPSRPTDYLARTAGGDHVVLLQASADANLLEVRYGAFTISGARTYEVMVGGVGVVGSFVALRLLSNAAEHLGTFLQLVGFLLEGHPSPVAESSLASILGDFEILFARRRTVSREAVLGLWGELWVIVASPNRSQVASKWHVTTYDMFDFAGPAATMEVKTHDGDQHIHRFAHRQLLGDRRQNWVVSLLVAVDASGKTVLDLLDEVIAHLPLKQSTHVRRLVLQTLEGDLETAGDLRWVRRERSAPCAVLSDLVPRVEVPSGGVITDVRYSVDLGPCLAAGGAGLDLALKSLV